MPSSEITAAEAAAIVGITRRAITEAIRAGSLIPSRKLPGRTGAYLLDIEQVRKFAELRRDGAA